GAARRLLGLAMWCSDDVPVSPSIRSAYVERLAARQAAAARLALRDEWIARARLAVCTAAAVLGWTVWQGHCPPRWLLVPAAIFVALVALHRRTRAAHELVRRSIDFYERGLARIEDRWMGTGIAGDRYRDPHHRYVDDLDLFGRGSLFELLCTCRTRPGEDRLAPWLAAAASPAAPRAPRAAAPPPPCARPSPASATSCVPRSTPRASSRGRPRRSR